MLKKLILIYIAIINPAICQVSQKSSPVVLDPFASKDGFFYMPDGVECEAAPSTDGQYKETICIYTVKWNCKINGIKPILKDHYWGDYAFMTVHHPVGDTLLGSFGEKVFFDDSVQNQDWIEAPYDAELLAGLKIKIHYVTKKQTTPVKILFNLRLHRIIP